MGRRIKIQRPERMKFEKRPDGVPKTAKVKQVARFSIGDVTWSNEGPIRARYVATEEGVIDLQNEGRPVRDGGMYSDHLTREDDAHYPRIIRDREGNVVEIQELGAARSPDRDITVRVRNTEPGDRVMVRPFENANGEVMRRIRDADEPAQVRQYYYVYVNGVPHGRQHNATNETDTASIYHNNLLRQVEVKWFHAGNAHAVHQENFAFELFDDNPMFTLEMAHRRAHSIPMPDAVPPNTAMTLDPGARPERAKRIHPWARWKDTWQDKARKAFRAWRHWQQWEKTGPGAYMERHHPTWVEVCMASGLLPLYVYLWVGPMFDLLQILNQ